MTQMQGKKRPLAGFIPSEKGPGLKRSPDLNKKDRALKKMFMSSFFS